MADFEKHAEALAGVGAKVIAVSVDPEDKSQEIADQVSYPVAYGVSRDTTDSIGSWWDENRNFVQPSEFVLNNEGKVVFASYSSGPLARLDPEDAIKMINYIEAQKAKS
ncbi:MAG: hypothetical protein CMM10_11575 [Rhodospirillaceae bacterium]|nr:hypothetical protein [Rhodospirillaceae bacterium]